SQTRTSLIKSTQFSKLGAFWRSRLLQSTMNKEGIQKVALRLAGAIEILAFNAVVMPRSWMEISHEWLGLGQMPHGPVLMFLIRQASYTYGMHGISLWVLALDVKRLRPLIILNGIAYLLAALVFG